MYNKLFPKWKTVNKIINAKIQVEVGCLFNTYTSQCIIYVQTKDKVFSNGEWVRCLIKTATITDTMDCDLVLLGLGLRTLDQLKNFKVE